ncbi:hypothetical protein KVT40_000737 [Elsinoe batatas]|uniref:Uncharacterized protein n=1 Tax=Elsinoe batatas TaxID=2601811 RepID=A0A8K0L9B0_9PEZI|nr:hypothetical protein KVT40_000737 [Elsinoe batatas]
MSHLKYYAYDGVGRENLKNYNYNQAVRVGDRIECAGQGILPADGTPKPAKSPRPSQVFMIKSYHVGLDHEATVKMIEELGKWMPDHKPVWTCLGVANLALPGMRVEIDVVAHDPDAK